MDGATQAIVVRYHSSTKPPPDKAEVQRFTEAVKTIMGVSKAELQKRIEEEKRKEQVKPSAASPSAVSSSPRVD